MRDAAMAGAVAIQAVSRAPRVAERLIADELGIDWDERALVRFAVEYQRTASLPLREVALRGFARARPEVTAAAAYIVALRRSPRVRSILASMNQTPNMFLGSPELVPWDGHAPFARGSQPLAAPAKPRISEA